MELYKKLGIGLTGLTIFQALHLMRPPKIYSKITPAKYKLEFKKVSLKTQDGVKLAAWWIPSKGNNRTLIVGHGYPFDKGNIFRATKWLHSNYNLFYFDHRSFGESSGTFTTGGPREAKDVDAAINWVRDNTTGPFGLYGFSLSAAAMLMADSELVGQAKALVVDSTYATLDNIVDHVYSGWGLLRWPFVAATQMMKRLFIGQGSPEKSIGKIKIPLLIMHSKLDSQVPVENAHQLYAMANKDTTELHILEKGDHGHSLGRLSTRKIIKEFLRKHVKKS